MQGESTSFAVMLRSTFDDGALTAIEYAGKPAWIASDIGRALGMMHHRDAARRLREETAEGTYWRDLTPEEIEILRNPCVLDTRVTSGTLVFEPGLYWLMMTSNTPRSEAFRAWLAEVHLPALRRGAVDRMAIYGASSAADRMAMLRLEGAKVKDELRVKATELAMRELDAKLAKKKADRDFKLTNARQELDHWRTRHRIMEQKLQAAWRNDAKMRVKLGMPPVNYAAEFTFTDDA